MAGLLAPAGYAQTIASTDFSTLNTGTVTATELSDATSGASWTFNALGEHNDAVYSITGVGNERGFLMDSVVGVGGNAEFARMTLDQSFALNSLQGGDFLQFSLKTASHPNAPTGGGRANTYRLFDTDGGLALEIHWVSNGNYQINDGHFEINEEDEVVPDTNLNPGNTEALTPWGDARLTDWDSTADEVQSLLVQINSDGTYQMTWSSPGHPTRQTAIRHLGNSDDGALGPDGGIGSFGAYSGFSQTQQRAYHLDDIEFAVVPEPRTYAAIFGLAALGVVLVIRTRRSRRVA